MSTKTSRWHGPQGSINSSKCLGVKIWWHWIKKREDLWAKFWKDKYALEIYPLKLIQMTKDLKGSQIWNLALNNKHIIQKHCFWEIQNGREALFWSDSWQQSPKVDQIPNLFMSMSKTKLPFMRKKTTNGIPCQMHQGLGTLTIVGRSKSIGLPICLFLKRSPSRIKTMPSC